MNEFVLDDPFEPHDEYAEFLTDFVSGICTILGTAMERTSGRLRPHRSAVTTKPDSAPADVTDSGRLWRKGSCNELRTTANNL